MNTENKISVNRLSPPTYRFLKVNDSTLVLPEKLLPADTDPWKKAVLPQGIVIRQITESEKEVFSAIETGMGPDVEQVLREAGTEPLLMEIPGGRKEQAVCLPVKAVCGKSLVQELWIDAAGGSEVSVILDITGEESGCAAVKGFFGLSVRIRAAAGARVHVIPVQRLSSSVQYFCDIGADCAENARVETTTLCLGGKDGHLGTKCRLSGDGASFDCEMGYYVRGDGSLDVNQVALHLGKQTASQMVFRGVLADRARKTLRGTIDFRTGSSDSVGDEQEDTLLLSPEVENRSVPVILCAEESVDGRHGATVGQLSEEMVFYMCSRGYSKEQARKLIVQARLKAVAARIPDSRLRWEVEQWIEKEIG